METMNEDLSVWLHRTELMILYSSRDRIDFEEISWIHTEFQPMLTYLQSVQVLNRLPENAKDLFNQTKRLIRKTEDPIMTYVKVKMQLMKTSVYMRPISYMKLRILLSEMQSIKRQIIDVKQQLEKIHLAANSHHPLGSSHWQSGFRGSTAVQVENLDTEMLSLSSSIEISDPVKLGELPSETSSVMPGSHALNIDDLPSYLLRCLYYFLLFPANSEIPTRRIIVLWVAEGLVPRRTYFQSDEGSANRYLDELIELNMVLVKTKKLNGKYKVCQLNENIRGALSTIAKEERFFQDTPAELYRVVDYHGNTKASSSVKNYRSVISFMSFNTQEGNKPGEDLGKFLRKCISAGCFLELRILDLEKVFKPKLPEAICNLTLLKYLGLRWTYLEQLPKYMNKLLNLQVLDVKHTYISILPQSIWSMQYLRHLYLSETYRTKFDGCPSDVSLDELQTLWGAFVDESTYVRNGLDTARNIRKLGLSCKSSSSDSEQLEAVNKWISNLGLLEVLRLKSRDMDGITSELHLKPLRNEKLSTVYLLGKLETSVVSGFPEYTKNLIDITLSGSELNADPMTSLGKLPQLCILRLLSQSVVWRSMLCVKESFPKLKILKIWKLENLEKWEIETGALLSLEHLEIRSCMHLEEWEVEEGALWSLQHLEISSCMNLRMLPDSLQHVDALQECILTSMPKQFINETKVRQRKLWQ